MAYVTKGELWDLLGDKALNFAQFLLSEQGQPVKVMLDNTAGVDLDSPLIQNVLLPNLLNAGVIDEAVINRVNEKIMAEKRYTQEELRDLILSNPELQPLIEAGDDNGISKYFRNVSAKDVAEALGRRL